MFPQKKKKNNKTDNKSQKDVLHSDAYIQEMPLRKQFN